jgi:hypothetical protein
MNRVRMMPKVFVKYDFVLPRSQVPTCHHENCLPPFFLQVIFLVAKVLEESILAIERKYISEMIRSYQFDSDTSSKLESLIVWMAVLFQVPQL